jgi:hypothetical protein
VKAEDISGYVYDSGEHNSSHDYILTCILRLLDSVQPAASSQQSVWVKDCLKWAVVTAVSRRRLRHMDGM